MKYLLVAALLVGGDAEPKEKQLKVVASTRLWQQFAPGTKDKLGGVVNGAEELAVLMGRPASKGKEAVEQAAKLLKVKDIDFGKYALVILTDGKRNTGGYSMEITGVAAEKDKVV